MAQQKQYLVRDPATGEYVWSDRRGSLPAPTTKAEQVFVSDALGFPGECLGDMEADRIRHGFTAVEFKEDPEVPGFYQTHIHGKRARAEYIAHREMTDRSSRLGAGQVLSPGDLRAAEQVSRRPGPSLVLFSQKKCPSKVDDPQNGGVTCRQQT